MSDNKQDETDDYDAIFDNSNSDSDKDVAIEVSDGDTIKPQEYIDAEPGFIDVDPAYTDVSKDTQDGDFPSSDVKDDSETEDTDIEEGIFAPARKERAVTKKSTSLMWAVSLLAFVGVGSFVYVTNPDILSKMTQNMDSDAVTVPNNFGIEEPTDQVAATDETSASPVATPVSGSEGETPIAPAIESADVSTDVIQPDIQPDDPDAVHTDASQAPTVAQAETPVDQPLDMTANVTTNIASNENIIPPSDETPTPLLGTEGTTGEIKNLEDATEAAKVAAVNAANDIGQPPVETNAIPVAEPEGKQADMASSPIDKAEETPSVVGVVTPPLNDTNAAATPNLSIAAPDVIAPTNEVYEDAVEANAAATTIVAAPEPEVVAAQKAAAEAAAKQKEAAATITASSKDKPIIVDSAEEKKRLDDANLDQYFDSPGGNILTMIPAPSMNAKKGSNESIIIVNKKGSKAEQTKTSAAASSKHVKIETTTLDTQLVSANRALKLGRYEAAKTMYDELYKLNPRDPQILSGRAVLLQKMGFADQAINAYEELLKLYPDNADAIVNWSGLVRKQYPAAALSKLLDLHMAQPQNALVTAQLGVANADAGNFGDALRYLNDAATIEPKNPLHFYNLAVISEKAGQRQQAVGYYEKALEVDAIYGEGKNAVPREKIYDRLAQIRGN